jgi:fermentation-respiration switch protein FrsA (DUF1100 family)
MFNVRFHTLSMRLLLFSILLFFLTGCANGIFFQPSRRMLPPPSERGLLVEPVRFEAGDGVALSGWWLPAEPPVKGTVVHFHGNAHNMSSHVQYAEWLPAAGYHLMVFDYRGYGRSEGSPDRSGLILDGAAALEAAAADPQFVPPLLVWGQSLGGTVALQAMAVSSAPVEAALIDSTFTGYADIAAEKMRQFPWWLQPLRLFRPLLISGGPGAAEGVTALGGVRLAFLHGDDDRVIPPHHSQQLHQLAPLGSQLWIVPDAGHCDAVLRFPEQVRPWIVTFFEGSEGSRRDAGPAE